MHLEYRVLFWSLYYESYINKLEQVQRRVTKVVRRMDDTTYRKRLEELRFLFRLQKKALEREEVPSYSLPLPKRT